MRTNKHKNQGIKDGKRKQFNPPSKGTGKTKSTFIGVVAGSPFGPPGMLIGGVLGYLSGDSKRRTKTEKESEWELQAW